MSDCIQYIYDKECFFFLADTERRREGVWINQMRTGSTVPYAMGQKEEDRKGNGGEMERFCKTRYNIAYYCREYICTDDRMLQAQPLCDT